ncbi:hypothetical protein SPRG_04532 [Saprolegnia parasitica CBS 223.65]|uniref:Uncharacterized protein n=1 Tax=Saprolegnia parasitica (strain CBS 223.65) TaxID=695850 RepID=A0A067CVU9_SAPPC|nr:hypothetical protein SPRG_04532 [Saprolegnia parasitica CBS 223.65]KDO30631.1 hypothetical protein SPRG_04532 [Saprolegnia parasitica CBS 223.65]|eukprot:XP_012198842.1 hypothetical protein SPRG_04532 [Saprolegnia parasitica CBS 223.65]
MHVGDALLRGETHREAVNLVAASVELTKTAITSMVEKAKLAVAMQDHAMLYILTCVDQENQRRQVVAS